MDYLSFAVVWFILAIVVGFMAGSRGRSGFGWFLLSLFISPLLTMLIVLLIGDADRSPSEAQADRPSPWSHVKCPDCRELVLRDARKCKHCGCRLVPQ